MFEYFLGNGTQQANPYGIHLNDRRIVNELKLAWINLVDQCIDAIGMLFYLIYLGLSNNWMISVEDLLEKVPHSIKLIDSRDAMSPKLLNQTISTSQKPDSVSHLLVSTLSLYEICYELSTLNQPYLLLLIFPEIRRKCFSF